MGALIVIFMIVVFGSVAWVIIEQAITGFFSWLEVKKPKRRKRK